MESDPRIGMAGPQLLNDDGSPQTSFEAVPTLATETLNRSLLKRLFPNRYPGKGRVFTAAEPVEALIGAVMMIRKDALDELHGLTKITSFSSRKRIWLCGCARRTGRWFTNLSTSGSSARCDRENISSSKPHRVLPV